VPPQSSGWTFGGEVGFHPIRVGVGKIDFVHRHDDRDVGRPGVGDRLPCLRHHRVVRRDDEHRDVRDLGAARTHCGERLVAGGVQERDLAASDVDLIRADVLRDPTRLGLDDGGLPDRVEQRRLAVIDVAHDRDHRRAWRQVCLGVLEDLRQLLLVGGMLDRHLALELRRDQLHVVVRERLRDLDHVSEPHHDLDDLRGADFERLRQVADRDAGGNRHRAGRDDDGLRLALGLRVPALARLPLVLRPVPALDHDSTLPPGCSLTRPDRAVGFIRFVSHQLSILVWL